MTNSPAGARRRKPPSVRYARVLLYLQASIWGLLCAGVIVSARSSSPLFDPALMFAAASVAGALAGAKAWLAHRISRGSRWTRQGVIVVESVMATLGAFLTLPVAIPEGGGIPALACFVGGGLSLVAAIALTRPPARQYFARPGGEVDRADRPSRPDDRGSASFRWLALPGRMGENAPA